MTIRKLLNFWFGKNRSGFYVFLGIAAACAYLAGIALERSENQALAQTLKQAGYFSFLAIAPAYFIHWNLHAAHWFLDHFKDTDHLPKKQISLVNSFSMTIFLTLTLGALPLSAFCLNPLWQIIARWFAAKTSLDKAVYPALHMEVEPVQAPDLSALFGEAKPTPPWILLLDRLFRAVGTLALGLLMILALICLLGRLWAWITKPRHFDGDEKIYLTPTWSLTGSPKAVPKKQKKKKGLRQSYDRKIRHLYRREILSRYSKKKQTPALSASPKELEQAVGLSRPALHTLYEKARYSQNGCAKADWEALSRAKDTAPTSEA